MKMIIIIIQLIILILVTLKDLANGCTMILVGRNASKDGKPMVAHTDDSGGTTADFRLIRVPAMDHPPGSRRAVYNMESGFPRLVSNERGKYYKPFSKDMPLSVPIGYIDQVKHTYAYFDQDYGMVNEEQLAIGESTCGAKTVGWPRNSPGGHGYNLFGIAELTKIALERCDNAVCAIKTMGKLAEEHGFYSEDSGDPSNPCYQDSAEALGIIDKYGNAWLFHILTGKNNASAIWAAQKIPDNSISVITNGFTIREIDLKDDNNYLASDNIHEIAAELGFWDKVNNSVFDFTSIFGIDSQGPSKQNPLMALYVGRRMWRVYDLVAPSLNLSSTIGYSSKWQTYPLSVKPDKKVNVSKIMNILGDYYQNTEYDMTRGIDAGPFGMPIRYDGPNHNVHGGWERPISMFRTMFSFVIVSGIGDDTSNDIFGAVLWYGLGSPHGTVYSPFSCRQQSIPETYSYGKQSEFSTKSAWWAFSFVNNWSYLRYNVISKDISIERNKMQDMAFSHYRKIVTTIHRGGKNNFNALADIEKLNNNFAEYLISQWWKLAWKLVGKYSDGYIVTGEKVGEMKSVGYPRWFLQTTSFSSWPGKTFTPPAINNNIMSSKAISIQPSSPNYSSINTYGKKANRPDFVSKMTKIAYFLVGCTWTVFVTFSIIFMRRWRISREYKTI